MVGITVRTIISADVRCVVSCRPTSKHEVELGPMIGSEITPQYSTLRLYGKEYIRDAENKKCQDMELALLILAEPAVIKLTDTSWLLKR